MSHHADETQAWSPKGIEESQAPGNEGAGATDAAGRQASRSSVQPIIPIRYTVHAILARAQAERHYRELYAKAREEAGHSA